MAAYGALVSVMHIIDQLQTHPHPPISIHQKQLESLTQLTTSLQEFLEGYSPHGGYSEDEDVWESRIAEAAYDAEDVIESYIINQIRLRSRNDVETISSVEFYQGLQKVTENMKLIKIEIKEKMVLQDQLHIIKSVPTVVAGSSRSTSIAQDVTMIGFDDVFERMLDMIIGGAQDRQIIPIVGMGGIGKTTLARNIYVSSLVQHHFDVLAWSTISQEYNVREILRQVLYQVDKTKYNESEEELGLHLYQYLMGRRYFIVMDDMWNIEVWDQVRRFFPNDRNGSKILVTTRLSNLTPQFNCANGVNMKFLDEYASWNLFLKTVFGEEICPLELEDIGMKIVKGCKGLPLAIAVVGGLLSKSEQTKEKWGFIEKNLSSIVNLDDNESCLQVLYMSYNNLPVHIKPCFLYMGRYDEDCVIPISHLVTFLVAEGLVKPITGKCLEDTAEEYIEELVDRNMVIVEKRKHCGKLKLLKMHDLLRDVCLREAQKLKFLCVLGKQSNPQGLNSQRRIRSTLLEWEYPTLLLQSLESASLVRTFVGECPKSLSYNFRLLRVHALGKSAFGKFTEEYLIASVNLRFLCFDVSSVDPLHIIPSAVYFLWNLQRLVLLNVGYDYIFEIWKMPQLRHVIARGGTLDGSYCLQDFLSDKEDITLKNLRTLFEVSNLKFCEGVLKRISNIKTLKLFYRDTSIKDGYRFNNMCCLHKLETLRLRCFGSGLFYIRFRQLVREVSFPSSLKKLTLEKTYLPWEDMKTKIGLLPLLQVLKLKKNSFIGSVWKTFEDQFPNLRFLLIENCDIECWITYKTHFPRLEHLHLCIVNWLEEIPSSIGDIPTLQSIKVVCCSVSVDNSAIRIKEEQEELGNEELQIHLSN